MEQEQQNVSFVKIIKLLMKKFLIGSHQFIQQTWVWAFYALFDFDLILFMLAKDS